MPRYEFDKIRPRDLTPIVAFYIEETYNKWFGLTAEQKKILIRESYSSAFIDKNNNPAFELKTASLLETLKQRGHISNWVPSEKNSPLDRLKIDFVVVRAGTEKAIGLQITSHKGNASERRKKIKNMFGEQIIAVIYFKTQHKYDVDEQEIEKRVLAAIYDEGLLTVDIDRPPKKDTESLFQYHTDSIFTDERKIIENA